MKNIRKILIVLSVVLLLQFLPVRFQGSNSPYALLFLAFSVVFALIIVFPKILQSVLGFRLTGIAMLILGIDYTVRCIQIVMSEPSAATVLHLVGFIGMFAALTLNYINQMKPKNRKAALPLPAELPYVAVIIPTYNEPLDVLDKTLAYVEALDYPKDRLFVVVSDDGHNLGLRRLCKKYVVHYIKGPRKDAKAGNLNNAVQFIEQSFPKATLLLTQDADEMIDASFLKKIIPYFENPAIAFVQTPKDAITPDGDPFGTRDRVFYDRIQVGRNGVGAAFACGSGCLWRIAAVKSIGGFSTWNVVEDLTTSYLLHSAGWKSDYHNEILSIGLAPDDIPGLLKQRGTWAVDGWRLFMFDNPLFKRGLSFPQRLQYFEGGLSYVSSAFFTPMLMVVPLLCALTGHFINLNIRPLICWALINVLYYLFLTEGNVSFMVRMRQFWDGQGPTHAKAFWLALWSRTRKPSYQVTRKTRQKGFYGNLIWVQFVYVFVCLAGITRLLFIGGSENLEARFTCIVILLYFICIYSGICKASFYKFPYTFETLYSYLLDLGKPSTVAAYSSLRVEAAD